ncbi:transcriptional regulator [Vibrio cholerae]|nr:transcriptional regulator [Vibrio cholerae]MVC69248.1 transcriptional regulator [Vibrio cholerae]MVC72879.1 transcriptional regulator [Vibrio cholerae]MVE00853.1 transcriptional regulator [Vibrio cholerae]MVE12137.1 transcriptional regulator [Vibrio cholerae]
MLFGINAFRYPFKWKGVHQQHTHNKRLKRDCQRVAFPVPMSRGGYSCCV